MFHTFRGARVLISFCSTHTPQTVAAEHHARYCLRESSQGPGRAPLAAVRPCPAFADLDRGLWMNLPGSQTGWGPADTPQRLQGSPPPRIPPRAKKTRSVAMETGLSVTQEARISSRRLGFRRRDVTAFYRPKRVPTTGFMQDAAEMCRSFPTSLPSEVRKVLSSITCTRTF